VEGDLHLPLLLSKLFSCFQVTQRMTAVTHSHSEKLGNYYDSIWDGSELPLFYLENTTWWISHSYVTC